jgi:transposase
MQSDGLLEQWHLDVNQVRQWVYEAERPRERESRHALWLIGQGWTQDHAAAAMERDPHTIGAWVEAFRQRGSDGVRFDPGGGSPFLDAAERAALKAAVRQPPAAAVVPAATWSWKAVRHSVGERLGRCLSRRSCLRYLHRLGFVGKQPKHRLKKADAVFFCRVSAQPDVIWLGDYLRLLA